MKGDLVADGRTDGRTYVWMDGTELSSLQFHFVRVRAFWVGLMTAPRHECGAGLVLLYPWRRDRIRPGCG